MNKLIELFNEYERPQTNHIYTAYEVKENMNRLDILQEFIKWLVDNDKIDFNKDTFVSLASELWCTAYDEKIVLMVLSISDTPIDDLISYLR